MSARSLLFKWTKGITLFAIIWNLMGVAAFLMHATMSDKAINLLPEAEKALYTGIPAWYTAAFTIAVFGGLLGSVLLFFRKKIAVTVLILSLMGILLQMYYNFFISKSLEVYDPGSMIMPILVIAIAVFLVWYARKLNSNGYLI